MSKTFVFVGDTAVGTALSENLRNAGYSVATGVSDAEVIFTYCATQADLEDVYFDSKGLVQQATKGTYLVDLSASTPGFARELNAVATVSDLHAVEAPLVVRDILVERAFSDPDNLLAFVACDEDGFEEIKAMIEVLASTVEMVDQSGSAQISRALLTLQTMAQLIAIMEADALCRAASVSGAAALSVARSQCIVAPSAVQLYEAVIEQRFSGDYTVAICMAELTAALMAADDIELILPGAEASLHLLELLAVIGGADMNPAALSLVYGEESACAAHGLDWARAEQTYGNGEDSCDCDDDCDCDCDDDCDCDHSSKRSDFSGGFAGYSAN